MPVSAAAARSTTRILAIPLFGGKAGAIWPVRGWRAPAPVLWPCRDRCAAKMSTLGAPLVLEQLARGYPEGPAQPLDRVRANEAEAAARAGEAVNAVQAQAGELGQGVGRQAARLQELPHA